MAKQQKLFISNLKSRFGGSLLKGNPKTCRALPNRALVHLVLRSTRAKGTWSLLKQAREIQKIVQVKARTHYIEIKSLANAGNHLHIVLFIQNKRTWAPFIREISNEIMKTVTGCRRGAALVRDIADSAMLSKKSIFWTERPFTRIISASRDLWSTLKYLKLNQIEVETGLDRVAARLLMQQVEYTPSG